MREIKEVFHNAAEREHALKFLQAYQTESTRLLNEYCDWHKILFARYQANKDMTWEQYMEERAPIWEKYHNDDLTLYKEYIKGARELGYDVGEE